MSFKLPKSGAGGGQSLRSLIADAVIARKHLLATLSRQASEEGSDPSGQTDDYGSPYASPFPAAAVQAESVPSTRAAPLESTPSTRALPPVFPDQGEPGQTAPPVVVDSTALLSLRSALRAEQASSGKLQADLNSLRSMVLQERAAREALDRRLEELSSNLPSLLSSSLMFASPGNSTQQSSIAATPEGRAHAEMKELTVEKQEAMLKRYIVGKLNARCQRKWVVSAFRLWFGEVSVARLHRVLARFLLSLFEKRRKLATLRTWFWIARTQTQTFKYFENFTSRTSRDRLRECMHLWRVRRMAILVDNIDVSVGHAESQLAGGAAEDRSIALQDQSVEDGRKSVSTSVTTTMLGLNGRYTHDGSAQAVASVQHGSAQAVAESRSGFAQTTPDVVQAGQQTTEPDVNTIGAQTTTPHLANGVAQTTAAVGHEVAVGNEEALGGAGEHEAVLGPAPAPNADMIGQSPGGGGGRRGEGSELEGSLRECLERVQRMGGQGGGGGGGGGGEAEELARLERGLTEALELAAAKECELGEARASVEELESSKEDLEAAMEDMEEEQRALKAELKKTKAQLRELEAALPPSQQPPLNAHPRSSPLEQHSARASFHLFDSDNDDDDDSDNAPSAAAAPQQSPAAKDFSARSRGADPKMGAAVAVARDLAVIGDAVPLGSDEEGQALGSSSRAELASLMAELRACRALADDSRVGVEQDAAAMAQSMAHLEAGWRAAQQELQVVREFIDTERRQLEGELEQSRTAAEQHIRLVEAKHEEERLRLEGDLVKLAGELEQQQQQLEELVKEEEQRAERVGEQSRLRLLDLHTAAQANGALTQVESQMTTLEGALAGLRGQVEQLNADLIARDERIEDLEAKLNGTQRGESSSVQHPRSCFKLFDDSGEEEEEGGEGRGGGGEEEKEQNKTAPFSPLTHMRSRDRELSSREEELRLMEQREYALELERSKAQQLESENALLMQSVEETEALLEQATEKLQLLVQDKAELLAELQRAQEENQEVTVTRAQLEEQLERVTEQLKAAEEEMRLAMVEHEEDLNKAKIAVAAAEMAALGTSGLDEKSVLRELVVARRQLELIKRGMGDGMMERRSSTLSDEEGEERGRGGEGADGGAVELGRMASEGDKERMREQMAWLVSTHEAEKRELSELHADKDRNEKELLAQLEALKAEVVTLRQQAAAASVRALDNGIGAAAGWSSEEDVNQHRARSEEDSASGSGSDMDLGEALAKERDAHHKLLAQNKELVKKVREWKVRSQQSADMLTNAKGELANLTGQLAGEKCESRGLREEVDTLKKALAEAEKKSAGGGGAGGRSSNASLLRDESLDSMASQPEHGEEEGAPHAWKEIDFEIVKEVLWRGDAEELEEQLELAVEEIKGRRSESARVKAAMRASKSEEASKRETEQLHHTHPAHPSSTDRGGVDLRPAGGGGGGGGGGRSEEEWEEVEGRCAEAERRLRALERDLADKTEKCEELEEAMETLQSEMKELIAEMEGKDKTIAKLTAEIAAKNRGLNRQASNSDSEMAGSDSEWEGDSESVAEKKQEAAVLSVLSEMLRMGALLMEAAQDLQEAMEHAAQEAHAHPTQMRVGGTVDMEKAEKEHKRLKLLEEELEGLKEVYHQTMEKMVEEKKLRQAADAEKVKIEAKLNRKAGAKDLHLAEERYEQSQRKVKELEEKVEELEEAHELTLAAMKESLEVTSGMLEETQRELSEYKERE